jgi:hypothetical protein
MERLKIIKELNNVANILEGNGRISEASQITNVLIKIAQQTQSGNGSTVQTTQPTPGQPTQGQTQQLSDDQIKQNIKNKFLDLLKLRSLAEVYQEKYNEYPKYFISRDNKYVIEGKRGTAYGTTLEQVASQIGTTIANVDDKKTKFAEDVAQKILNAKNWPDPQNDASITKAINENYELGYNLLAGTYYIGSKSNSSDNIDKKNIDDLKDVFLKLGEHYKKHNNQFPVNIYQAFGKSTPEIDVNQIILEVLDRKTNDKFQHLEALYKNHPNYEDIKRGFIVEHNRRNPNNQITSSNPQKADTNS